MPTQALKTYRARNLNEALASVKSELGPEAVILSARRIRGGLLGTGAPCLELKAIPPTPKNRKKAVPAKTADKRSVSMQPSLKGLRQALDKMREEIRMSRFDGSRERDELDRFASRLRLELEETATSLRAVLAQAHLGKTTGLPDAQVQVIRQLLDNGVDPGHAEALVRSSNHDADDVTAVRRAVARFLVENAPIASPLQIGHGQRVAAFVGPTGVGKTTTIAKIAAACMTAGRRVALITTDAYRVAAVGQLKVYAECMRLPLAVCQDADEVRRAVERFSRQHVVLIDTPGVGPRSSRQIEMLSAMLSRSWVNQVHLVLAAATSHGDLRQLHHAFRLLRPDRMVCTKVDDATAFGLLFSGPVMTHTRLSYICAGQRVPEDLEAATPERVTRLILTASNHQTKGVRR